MMKVVLAAIVGTLSLESCAPYDLDRERMKEEIKREILADLAREKAGKAIEPAPARPPEPPPTPTPTAPEPATPGVVETTTVHRGMVTGSIVYDGVGLAECKVKLVRLSAMGAIFPDYREGEESIVATDSTGAYRFEHVAPGRYRLKWQPKGESGWIRKSHDRPDVDVAGDASVAVKAIETNKPTIPFE